MMTQAAVDPLGPAGVTLTGHRPVAVLDVIRRRLGAGHEVGRADDGHRLAVVV